MSSWRASEAALRLASNIAASSESKRKFNRDTNLTRFDDELEVDEVEVEVEGGS